VLAFRRPGDPRPAALPVLCLTAGDYQHHVALIAFGGAAARRVSRGPAELGRFAVRSAHPLSFAAEAFLRSFDFRRPRGNATDRERAVPIYLSDPNGHGFELYYDLPGAGRPDHSTPLS